MGLLSCSLQINIGGTCHDGKTVLSILWCSHPPIILPYLLVEWVAGPRHTSIVPQRASALLSLLRSGNEQAAIISDNKTWRAAETALKCTQEIGPITEKLWIKAMEVHNKCPIYSVCCAMCIRFFASQVSTKWLAYDFTDVWQMPDLKNTLSIMLDRRIYGWG